MKFGEEKIGRKRKLPSDAQIIELFNAGLSNSQIATRFACTAQAVGNCVRRLKLTRAEPAPVDPAPAVARHVVRRHFASGYVSLPFVAGYYETDRHD
ncbi:hypothetical protein [Sinorhizobium chiapasense]|uniref:Uncharacterized protein n=1 Tax=Sinorhizobium chiapasense TaxID=501572 RepID=A0ABZ2BEB4_9HYPH